MIQMIQMNSFLIPLQVTGNTWDLSPKGIGRTGNGKQEEFRNCADIQIH